MFKFSISLLILYQVVLSSTESGLLKFPNIIVELSISPFNLCILFHVLEDSVVRCIVFIIFLYSSWILSLITTFFFLFLASRNKFCLYFVSLLYTSCMVYIFLFTSHLFVSLSLVCLSACSWIKFAFFYHSLPFNWRETHSYWTNGAIIIS